MVDSVLIEVVLSALVAIHTLMPKFNLSIVARLAISEQTGNMMIQASASPIEAFIS